MSQRETQRELAGTKRKARSKSQRERGKAGTAKSKGGRSEHGPTRDRRKVGATLERRGREKNRRPMITHIRYHLNIAYINNYYLKRRADINLT